MQGSPASESAAAVPGRLAIELCCQMQLVCASRGARAVLVLGCPAAAGKIIRRRHI